MNKPPQIRLDRLLSNLGYGSRREVKQLVAAGLVNLDGIALADSEKKITLEQNLSQRIEIYGEPIDPLPGLVLIMHKPVGLSCSRKEEGGVVYDLLPERWQRRNPPISSIGRLDKETSGLLLFTDDGQLLHQISAPKKAITKRYRVALQRPLREDEKGIFFSGNLLLSGETKPLLPASLIVNSSTSATVEISEGRYHQVRRMFAAVGNEVVTLHRESIGGLELPKDLKAGEWRLLSDMELEQLLHPPLL